LETYCFCIVSSSYYYYYYYYYYLLLLLLLLLLLFLFFFSPWTCPTKFSETDVPIFTKLHRKVDPHLKRYHQILELSKWPPLPWKPWTYVKIVDLTYIRNCHIYYILSRVDGIFWQRKSRANGLHFQNGRWQNRQNFNVFSDFNENLYLGLCWSEELVDNDEICIQGHFYDATIFKLAANKIVKLSMVSDFNEHWYLRVFEVRNWLVIMKLASTCPNSDMGVVCKHNQTSLCIAFIMLPCLWIVHSWLPSLTYVSCRTIYSVLMRSKSTLDI
jgi:hypothetical protein